MRFQRWASPVFVIPVFACALLVSGCGGGNKPAAESKSGTTNATSATSDKSPGNDDSDEPAQASVSGGTRRPDEIWTDKDGNKYLGMVPFDAFFDRPHEVAQDNTQLAGDSAIAGTGSATLPQGGMTTSIQPDSTATGTETPASTDTSVAVSGSGWADKISGKVLDEEITTIRNFLNATLQSVGSYNSSMLMIEQKAASIAVLAHILSDHPGDVSWKEDAPYIRDLAKKMNESTLQRGKKDQVRLQLLLEKMTATFNRSRPADLEAPPADDGFSDVAGMSSVMKRMGEAEQRLKVEAGSESAFESKKAMIQHEATILGTFTHIISREEYGYGDDPEFKGFANKVIEAAQTIRNSTEANDFSSYEVALSTISTNCQACHSAFKNN